jgi:hypothetical protein
MPPSTKKKNMPHRVRCICCKFDCYLGHYIDASGTTQTGVEVLPATRAAHELAERAEEASRNLASSDEGTLLGAISRLDLNPVDREGTPPRPSSHSVSPGVNRSQVTS